MNGDANPTGTGLPSSIELITKLGTVSVVALYVLGLLVTNAHLMGLGIADFSALQGRFILTGVLFLLYGLLLLGFPLTLTFVPWTAYKWFLRSRPPLWRLTLVLLVVLPVSAWTAIMFYGSILGYLYPWGSSYESLWADALSLRASVARTPQFLRLVQDAFLHVKTVVGLVSAYALLGLMVVARRTKPDRAFVGLLIFIGVASMTVTLFGYAQSVFPNLPYNLGGGQPRIIQLHMRPTDSLLLRTSGLAMEEAQGGPLVSVPLALWHQDTSFLYVTPASTQDAGAALLTAITADAVEVVDYLGGYVKVTSGSRIQDAHVDPVARRR